MESPPQVNHSRSLGTIMIVFNSIWLYLSLERFYGQAFGGILYIFHYPNYFLILNIIFSIIGIALRIYVRRKQIAIKYGLLINGILFILSFILSLYLTA